MDNTRRDFLKGAVISGALVAGLPKLLDAAQVVAPSKSGKSKIIIARNTGMLKGDVADQKEIEKTVGRAMCSFTGKPSPLVAWKSLFGPKDVVGIKINGLFGPSVSTRPEVVNAVVVGLTMAGVKPENIIVWDRAEKDLIKSGFTPNKTGPGVIYFSDDGDWGEDVKNGSFHGKVSKVFERITALINMPLVKHHRGPGFTCCMKNHYGSFNNPGEHHGNGCDPYLADINAIPQIKGKTRLVVADVLKPQADGGPGRNGATQWEYHSLIVGADPVAVDFQAYQIIEARRKELGLESVSVPAERCIASAAARGVGTNDPSKIDLVRI